MEFTYKVKVSDRKTINSKGRQFHVVTLAGFGFSHEFFIADELLPDFLQGKEVNCRFQVYRDKQNRLSVRLAGLA